MAKGTKCVGSVIQLPVFNELTKRVGNDEAFRLICSVFDGEHFDEQFVEFYKSQHRAVPKETGKKALAESIIDFKNKNRKTVKATTRWGTRSTTAVSAFGYENLRARQKGIANMAQSILNIYKEVNENKTKLIGDPLDYYWHAMKVRHADACLAYCAELTNKPIKTIKEEFNTLKSIPERNDYLTKVLDTAEAPIYAKNSLALWRELNGSKEGQEAIRREILSKAIVTPVLKSGMNAEEKTEELQKELGSEVNGTGTEDGTLVGEVELDDYIGKVTNEAGKVSDYMKHCTERIAIYFNTLPKFNSTEKVGDDYSLKTDAEYSFPEHMSAKECVDLLYSSNDNFYDIESMINFIKQVSTTVPGFESFAKFAEDLTNNLDFAAEVFRTFMKCTMERIQIVHDNGASRVKVSTQKANKQAAMLFNMLNDAKSRIEEDNDDYYAKKLKALDDYLKTASQYARMLNDARISDAERVKHTAALEDLLDTCKQELTDILKIQFTSLQSEAINAYIHLANNAVGNYSKQISNINELKTALNKLIDANKTSRKRYNERQANIIAAKRHNDKIKEDRRNGTWKGETQPVDMKALYKSDFITPSHNSAITAIRDLLVPYSVVPTEKNVPNVKGNRFSVVINNSFITDLKGILKSSTNVVVTVNGQQQNAIHNNRLEDWGASLYRDPRNRHSSILFQQRNKQGDVISEGIFGIDDNGDIYITEDGPKLLEIYMLDGSSDMDTGANMTYDEMTFGDFCPTSFIQFFGTEENSKVQARIASYFPRIPSDATTMYSIRAPRYDTSDLFVDADPNYRINVANEILSNIPVIPNSQFVEAYPISNETVMFVGFDAIQRIIRTKSTTVDANNGALLQNKESGRGQITFASGNFMFIIAGDVVTEEGSDKVTLNNAELRMVVAPVAEPTNVGDFQKDDNNSVYKQLYNNLVGTIRNALDKDFSFKGKNYAAAEIKMNRNARVFNILRNQFKQEMVGAAIALDHYFDIEYDQNGKGGWIKPSNSSGEKEIKVREDRDNFIGYANYHLDKAGKVLGEADGKYTLGGKVFHSDKFTITIPETDEDGNTVFVPHNFLDEVITTEPNEVDDNFQPIDDGKIHILYGGAGSDSHLHIVKSDDKVVDVEFTNSQQELIDQQIEKYLRAYLDKAETIINQNRKFIKGVTVNESTIREFAINNAIFLMSCDDLFDGDTGFYKNAQTVLKRAKQYEGSGMLYSCINGDSADGNASMSFLNEGTYKVPITDEKGNIERDDDGRVRFEERKVSDFFSRFPQLTGLTARTTFRGVTVANSKMTRYEVLDPIVEELAKTLPGKTKQDKLERAKEIIYGQIEYNKNGTPKIDKKTNQPERRGGFSETKVNDAQSYITFEEWIRRIAGRGQLQQYMPLIEKIMDESTPLTAADLEEFVQVQKNFYYDTYYDERYGIFVPRQIKNAEFVLVPRFIKGTELEAVYNLMKETGIDQLNTVETSKSANEEIITLWDNNGDLTGVEEFKNKVGRCAQDYEYRHLYTQQETPQHMDATNKIGIQIAKKIIDNISPDSPLYAKKEEYMNLLVANIKESYDRLLKEFGITINADGSIKYNNATNSVDLKKLYDKLGQEMRRLGVDQNMMDYITLDEDGAPIMPPLINTVLVKFESIFQSVFNNSITRQRLPGFHAAQVTNIGWKPLSDSVEKVSYSKDLKYRPVVDGKLTDYIEVMVPASMFGIDRNSEHYKDMTDQQILEELEAKGIDTIIGYRIPTEGKQSVCNMKIVGFVDDGCGSTIIVPNEWVSQTGSDFDIDSVYGIKYETYTNAKGEIFKVEYIEKDADIFDYYRYLKDNKVNVDSDDLQVKDKIEDRIGPVRDIYNGIHDKASEIFKKLPEIIQNVVKKNDGKIAKKYEYANSTDIYLEKLKSNIRGLKKVVRKNPNNKDINLVKDYIKQLELIQSFLKTTDYKAFKGTVIEEELTKRIDKLSEQGKASGLLTFEEFKEGIEGDRTIELNSRQARNNRILDNMKAMLGATESLEENVSRSNFDDIIYWRDKLINKNNKIERDNRSPYDVFDQMRFQEDAISGTHLKGISVSMDTWCSVCNTVRPNLTKPINIVYDAKDFPDKSHIIDEYNGKDVSGNGILVSHDKYGWSEKTNRNVVGRLLTVYSSQTTAHILDAVKEGAVPGVNVYTFPAYKTLLNIGSDYKTAIAFIMQPGVRRIIDAYNSNNSVFNNTIDNPVHQAIVSIAKDLGIEVKVGTPITKVLSDISTKYKKEFNKIFNVAGTLTTDTGEDLNITLQGAGRIPLIVSKLEAHLQDNAFRSEKSKLLFDLGVVLAFHHLNTVASEIQSISRLCNPDKFGAKQTIYATRKVFEDIHRQMFKYKRDGSRVYLKSGEPARATSILNVGKGKNAKHILAAIYPGVDDPENTLGDPIKGTLKADPNDSAYKSLAAYLKYSSALSVILSREVFPTQNPFFVYAVRNFASAINFPDGLPEDVYNNVQKYMIGHAYASCPMVCYPVEYDASDELRHIKPRVEDAENPRANENAIADEKTRIYGFFRGSNTNYEVYEDDVDENGKKIVDENENVKRRLVSYPFKVKDFNNPTEEEIKQYLTLSPAQKVSWLKSVMDDPELFSLYEVQLHNGSERAYKAGTQTIEYNDNIVEPDVVYNLFNEAFANDNPLIQLAALDLIKYAITVEGLNMRMGAVSKTIPNAPLLNEEGNDGIGLIKHVQDYLYDLGNFGNELSHTQALQQIYEDYLRTNPAIKGIPKLYLNKANKAKFKINTGQRGAYGTIYIKDEFDTAEDGTILPTKEAFEERMSKAHILKKIDSPDSDSSYRMNKYIRIIMGDNNTLYKITRVKDGYILYPLNPLDENEHGRWSARESNNTEHPSKEIYEALIAAYNAAKIDAVYDNEFISEVVSEQKAKGEWKQYWFNKTSKFKGPRVADDFNLQQEAEADAYGMSDVLYKIKDYLSSANPSAFYIYSPSLGNKISTPGPKYGSVQVIKLDDKTMQAVLIHKLSDRKRKDLDKLLKKDEDGNYIVSDSEFTAAIEQFPESLKAALRNARDAKLKHVKELFQVTPFTDSEGVMHSAEEETLARNAFRAVSFIKQDVSRGVDFAIERYAAIQARGIENKTESLKNNSVDVHREMAAYAVKKAQELKTRFENFDGNVSILDDSVQELLKNNEVKVNEYLELLNEIKAFLEDFEFYTSFDVTSVDPELKFFIEKIKEAVEPITRLDINTAAHKFAENYLTSLSTNKLLVDNIIKIYDGYWKSSGAMWRFHDIMENGNPLMQTIGKDIMGNLEAKRIATEKDVRKFRKEFNEIKRLAREAGMSIDFDKFIDKNGRLIQRYKPEFVDNLTELSKKVKDVAAESGVGSIEHLKAKLAYDTFKATYLNQEADPAYYIRRVILEKAMLEQHPQAYSAYMKAYLRRNELLNTYGDLGLSDEQEKELLVQERIISGLIGSQFVIGHENPDVEQEIERLSKEYIRTALSGMSGEDISDSIDALATFANEIKDLNDEYFEYEPVFGFEEQLENNLKTIADYEERVDGIPRHPASELNQIPRYVEAKKWIRENAKFELNAKFDLNHQPLNVGAKITQALSILGRNSNGRSAQVRKYISDLERQKGIQIVDEQGVINATLLTDEELNIIRLMMDKVNPEVTFNPHNSNAPRPTGISISGASDRILISSAPKSNVVYNSTFYNAISRRGRRRAYTPLEAAQIAANGNPDQEYFDTVHQINKILTSIGSANLPLYRDGIVHIEEIPMTVEGIATLNLLKSLYDKLDTIERATTLSDEEDAARRQFIRDNVDFDTTGSNPIIRAQMLAIRGQKESVPEDIFNDYVKAWAGVTFDLDEDENPRVNEDGSPKFNSKLYATMKPKAEVADRYTDHRYTDALAVVNRYYKKRPSKYYQDASHEAMQRDRTEPGYYKTWYEKNHVYNAESGKVEPLDVWMETYIDTDTIREDDQLLNSGIEGYETKMKWVPRPRQAKRKVKDGTGNSRIDKRNPNYDPDSSLFENYAGVNHVTDQEDTEWASDVELNQYEIRMRDFMQQTLIDSVTLDREKYRFKKGYLPYEADYDGEVLKRVAKEAGKLFGLVVDKRREQRSTNEEVGFENDRIPSLPMSQMLFSKEAGSKEFTDPEPVREKYSTEDEFNEAHARWEEDKRQIEEHNQKIHQDILNRDWENVISNFLTRQGERRAVQAEKHKMYYLLSMLERQEAYMREHDLYGDLKQDDSGYITSVDKDLIEQTKTFIRRMLYDEYKDSDSGLIRAANRLQAFTSADYMMLNIKGGISNVTLGLTGMLSEAAAGEYLSGADLRFGMAQWNRGVISFVRSMYDETSYTKQDAIVKLFKVVDYDEISGVSTETTLEKYAERLRNIMFSPQTMGEHFMQNSVLFGMLRSHKIVELDDEVKGLKYGFMNKNEYIAYQEAKVLNELLTEEQLDKLAKFKEDIRKDAQTVADYAWWKKDILAEFIALNLDKDERDAYIKAVEAKREEFAQEFEDKQDMWSQIELGEDGYASFVEGSKLAELDTMPCLDGSTTCADLLIGQFSERVRKVNNKIHGVYNKRGRAYIENKWWGSLFMQYHKHLPFGLLKRWRSRGYYNETRGATEKGMISSIQTLFSLNFRMLKKDLGLSEDQLNALESVRMILGNAYEYFTLLKQTWHLIPEYDRANVRRNIGDFTGVLAGIAGVLGVVAWQGDDDDDGIISNLMLYEFDRLASESFLYNPIGLWSESKTLMSTPIAGESIIDDALSAIKNIALAIVGGEDYDGLYHSGQFAGRHKLTVYLERRTPIWNGIRSIRDIPDNNHYFKRGQTVIGLFKVKKWIGDE